MECPRFRRQFLVSQNIGQTCLQARGHSKDQLGALSMVTSAVVLWNTLYIQEALSHPRNSGETPMEEHLARLSPLIYGHINMLGHYAFSLPEAIFKGELRPLNINTNNELTS